MGATWVSSSVTKRAADGNLVVRKDPGESTDQSIRVFVVTFLRWSQRLHWEWHSANQSLCDYSALSYTKQLPSPLRMHLCRPHQVTRLYMHPVCQEQGVHCGRHTKHGFLFLKTLTSKRKMNCTQTKISREPLSMFMHKVYTQTSLVKNSEKIYTQK